MVSIPMIDIVTVVFREELPVLRLQALSIALYVQPNELEKIYIIVNDDTVDTSEIDISWWGSFQDRVVLVHRSAWAINYAENGWLTQQLLKLQVTDLCTSKWSMILDAKTIFVRPVPNLATRPQVGVLDIYPVFDVSRRRVNELFKVDLQKQLGPGGVPFILNNLLAQEMISEIQNLTNKSFADWFQEQGMVTEFILYSGYVLQRCGSYDVLYNTTDCAIVPCNLCHTEVASFDRKFAEMQQSTTVSIHRCAWSQLSQTQQQQYTNFLNSRGIK
jgi:hypothetical protein